MLHPLSVSPTLLPRSDTGLDLLDDPCAAIYVRCVLHVGHLHFYLSVHVRTLSCPLFARSLTQFGRPREKTWTPFLEGHCIDVAAAIVVQGAINLFLDIGLLITPLWAIWRLQLPLKRKIGISAVFGVGILSVSFYLSRSMLQKTNTPPSTCAIAIAGVVFRIPLLTDPDLTWLISKVGIWTCVSLSPFILSRF
jgi:hypothetical protein